MGALATAVRTRDRVAARVSFDWIAVALGAWLVGGFYLDLWAHRHGRAESFFTPWHAVLYGGLLVNAVFYGLVAARAIRRGSPLRDAFPKGYELPLLGVLVFGIGGFADMLWHLAFGIEVSLDALLSPTHLVLATGGLLILIGPLRAALAGAAPRAAGVLSLAFVLAVLAAFTQFASPAVEPLAERLPARSILPRQADLYAMRPDGSAQTRLTNGDGLDHWLPRLSPDGRRLAYSAFPALPAAGPAVRESDRIDIYVANADGSGARKITDGPHQNWLGGWSPDGARIVFASDRDGALHIYVMNADGSDQRRVGDTALVGGRPAWSPDGRSIAFAGGPFDEMRVYVMAADGTNVRRLTAGAGNEYSPAWSRDGARIALAASRGGNTDVYVVDVDGSAERRLTTDPGFDSDPAWSPDGSRIAFVSDRDWNAEIYVVGVDGTGETNLSRDPSLDDGDFGFSWSADGPIVYTAHGRRSAWQADGLRESLGIASTLVQSALLAGVIVFALTRRLAPFGAFTIVFGLYGVLSSVLTDEYRLILAAIVAGALADLLARGLERSRSRDRDVRLIAFAVPATYAAVYLLTLQLGNGVAWSVHLAFGSIVLAGLVGVLLSLLVAGGAVARETS